MKLIVGLGNPGVSYRDTRHNIGFTVVDAISRKAGLNFKRSLLLKGRLARGSDLFLIKPNTFMNLSGLCIRRVVDRFKIDIPDILVICDDLSLPLGKLRLRRSGSAGGHKGLASIIDSLQTEEVARLRIGIGKPQDLQDASDFVLSEFSETEKRELTSVLSRAEECALAWNKGDIEKVMASFN